MEHNVLIGVAAILVLGIAAQWLAWRIHLPSILLLLLFGFFAGPVTHFINPDELMGDLLFPVVSLSVAIILFEGGLTLRFAELREIRRAVRNLITIGAVVTWVIASTSAHFILDLELSLAVLLGAILIVTGPTVVIPLLRHVRPVARLGSVAKWEGIMIDPIGATMAVLVFEAILVGGFQEATSVAVFGLLRTVIVGLLVGAAGAALMVLLLRRYWIPDFLQNSVTLMVVVAVFALSDEIQPESGLLTVTLMGILLANQRFVPVKHIIEFKENLRVLLISSLFILLSARLDFEQLTTTLGWNSFLFVAVVILVARPASVLASTYKSRLDWRERIFLAWLAPRGIVAAAVASVFSLRLAEAGFAQADQLISVTFLIIVVTVALYGLTAKPLARALGVAQKHPQGFLIMGGHSWGLQIAQTLQDLSIPVVVVDSNWNNIQKARMAGLPTYYGNILAEYAMDEIELNGIGRLLAMTPNDEANSLACLHFIEVFSRAEVYQLSPHAELGAHEDGSTHHLLGRLLFSGRATYNRLKERFDGGATVKATKLTESFDIERYRALYGERALPLFRVSETGQVTVFAGDHTPGLRPGHTLVALVEETDETAEGDSRR